MTAPQRWTRETGPEAVRDRADGLCEAGIPDVCTRRAGQYEGEFSHRKSRKQGGGWEPWNGVRCCHACHSWVEGNWTAAVDHGLRVPSHGDPERTPVFLRLQPWWHGWWWLRFEEGKPLYEPTGPGYEDFPEDWPEVPSLPDQRRTA